MWQAELASTLRPVVVAALKAFGPQATNTGSSSSSSSSSSDDGTPSRGVLYSSPAHLLGAMSLSRLLVTVALVDPSIADMLCKQFNAAAAAATSTGASSGVADTALLDNLHPDMQDAVFKVAAAQPPGCKLTMPGAMLLKENSTGVM